MLDGWRPRATVSRSCPEAHSRKRPNCALSIRGERMILPGIRALWFAGVVRGHRVGYLAQTRPAKTRASSRGLITHPFKARSRAHRAHAAVTDRKDIDPAG